MKVRNYYFVVIFAFLCTFQNGVVLATPQKSHEHVRQLDFQNFQNLPVLHEGRVKPFRSFAKSKLKQIYGREYYKNLSAVQLMAALLFDPSSMQNEDIFFVPSLDVRKQLKLNVEDKYFSLQDLSGGIAETTALANTLVQKKESALTSDQKKLLQLHENVVSILELMRSFSLLLPLNIELPAGYQNFKDSNFIKLSVLQDTIEQQVKNTVQQKGENLENYTTEEQSRAVLSFQLSNIQRAGARNTILKIIPGDNQEWHTPWQLYFDDEASISAQDYFGFWKALTESYRRDNAEEFSYASQAALNWVKEREYISDFQFAVENFYTHIKPYQWALGLYGLAGLFLILGFWRSRKTMMFMSVFCLSAAVCMHISGIVSRIVILERPPVGTLYESVLFVALVCGGGALLSIFKSNNATLVLAGLLSSIGLLVLSPVIAPQGEDLQVLVAVLNTNFWLATHVIVITAGYGVCILAACLSHFYLAQKALQGCSSDIKLLQNLIYKTSLAALLLTAIGTILGGIWADQSWGRFWGWDPKENGALLIVLWLIWALHGRISKQLDIDGFAVAIAFLNIVVAIAWFGVNLLGVGLHSYGFTSGLAIGLSVFCTLECVLLGALFWAVKRKGICAQ